MGDINQQTIAGLIATGSHGTGLSFGVSSTQIAEMEIITANGEKMICSESKNADIFKAAQVSLGTLGIISRVKIKVLPKYYMYQERSTVEFDTVMVNMIDSFNKNRNYEFFWFPYTDYVFEKKSNIAPDGKGTNKFKKLVNDYVLENASLWLLCEISRYMPRAYRKHANSTLRKLLDNSMCTTIPSTECYATPRFVNHREIEYSIPLDEAIETLKEIRDLLNHHKTHMSFPVEVRSVAGDDIYLSPNYGNSSIWIAVHAYTKDDYEDVFKEVEKIFKNHNGRPHWGKMHWLGHDDIKRLYPRLESFNEIRRQLDAKGMFLNNYLSELLGQ